MGLRAKVLRVDPLRPPCQSLRVRRPRGQENRPRASQPGHHKHPVQGKHQLRGRDGRMAQQKPARLGGEGTGQRRRNVTVEGGNSSIRKGKLHFRTTLSFLYKKVDSGPRLEFLKKICNRASKFLKNVLIFHRSQPQNFLFFPLQPRNFLIFYC